MNIITTNPALTRFQRVYPHVAIAFQRMAETVHRILTDITVLWAWVVCGMSERDESRTCSGVNPLKRVGDGRAHRPHTTHFQWVYPRVAIAFQRMAESTHGILTDITVLWAWVVCGVPERDESRTCSWVNPLKRVGDGRAHRRMAETHNNIWRTQ